MRIKKKRRTPAPAVLFFKKAPDKAGRARLELPDPHPRAAPGRLGASEAPAQVNGGNGSRTQAPKKGDHLGIPFWDPGVSVQRTQFRLDVGWRYGILAHLTPIRKENVS